MNRLRFGLRMMTTSPGGIRINKCMVCVYLFAITAFMMLAFKWKTSVEHAAVPRTARPQRKEYTFNPRVVFIPFDIKRRAQLAKQSSPRIRLYEESNAPKEEFVHECVPLKTLIGPTSICIYETSKDRFVSGLLKSVGTYEEGNLQGLGQVLLDDPNIVFLDIGCNIGAYTIYAAKFGTKVVSIDPLAKNLQLLSESVKRLRIQDHVVLLWNAISDVHEDLKLIQGQANNVGSTTARKLNESNFGITPVNYTVPSITMNDLVPLLEGKKVFIKMDIESYELKALKASEKFFEKVDVRCVMMEVVSHLHSKDKRIVWIDKYLQGLGFKPYNDAIGQRSLSDVDYKEWSIEAFWVKKRINAK